MAPADAAHVEFASRGAWRTWLMANHDTSPGVWVVYPKKSSPVMGPEYEELILEALCFGWIDGTLRPVDAERTSLYFCPRRKGSVWAATNKARVEGLIADGLMQAAGTAAIERAKADGSWSILDRSESLTLPDELTLAFAQYPGSAAKFESFPAGARKQLIYRVDSAKRAETRMRRADEIARLAQQGIRADRPAPDS